MKIRLVVVLTCLAACGGTTTVGKGSVTVAVSSSANPSVSGQSVLFTASFTGGSPGGTVAFKDGDTTIPTCGAQVIGSTGATCGASFTAGAHSITAVYAGDDNFNGATSNALAQVIDKATTSVLLTRSPDTSTVFGQTITFTAGASIAAPGSGTPTGVVTISDGSATLCTSPSSSNVASCAVATLGAGSHPITAAYSGDTNFTASTSPVLTQTVAKASSSISQFVFTQGAVGGAGSFSVTVSSAAATPAGTVSFTHGATVITSCTLAAGASSTASCTTGVTVPTGSQTFTATYTGDANLDGATASTTVTVN